MTPSLPLMMQNSFHEIVSKSVISPPVSSYTMSNSSSEKVLKPYARLVLQLRLFHKKVNIHKSSSIQERYDLFINNVLLLLAKSVTVTTIRSLLVRQVVVDGWGVVRMSSVHL